MSNQRNWQLVFSRHKITTTWFDQIHDPAGHQISLTSFFRLFSLLIFCKDSSHFTSSLACSSWSSWAPLSEAVDKDQHCTTAFSDLAIKVFWPDCPASHGQPTVKTENCGCRARKEACCQPRKVHCRAVCRLRVRKGRATSKQEEQSCQVLAN